MADALDEEPPLTLIRPFQLADRDQWPKRRYTKSVQGDKQEMEIVIAQEPEDSTQGMAGWIESVIMTMLEVSKTAVAFSWGVPKQFTVTGQVL